MLVKPAPSGGLKEGRIRAVLAIGTGGWHLSGAWKVALPAELSPDGVRAVGSHG